MGWCEEHEAGLLDRSSQAYRVCRCRIIFAFLGDACAMMQYELASPTVPAAAREFLPVLLALFVGSGCAALIYEVVWLQVLQLVIGSTAVSMGVLLGTFMGGMCLGSLMFPQLVSSRRHPLRVYALLELGIGAIGLAVLFVLPHVEEIYTRYSGHGLPGILLRGVWPRFACCPLPCSWVQRCRPLHAGWKVGHMACRGWASSTVAISPAPWSAACSPVFTCCASTTSPRRPSWLSPSMQPWP